MKKYSLSVLIIMSLAANFAFAEDKGSFAPFYPANDPQDAQKAKVEARKNRIRNSASMERLLTYLAARKEDLSVCRTEGCRSEAKDLLSNKYLGEGRCDAMKDPATKDLCIALKSNNCNQLSVTHKDFCQAIIDEDLSALVRVANSGDFLKYSGGEKVTKVDMQEFLALYAGFKYYNPVASEKYLSGIPGRLWNKLGFRILFFEDPDAELDKILTDLAYLDLSKEKGDPNLCSQIKNSDIKKACTSAKGKSLDEFFE